MGRAAFARTEKSSFVGFQKKKPRCVTAPCWDARESETGGRGAAERWTSSAATFATHGGCRPRAT
jgi:hypothetical protein